MARPKEADQKREVLCRFTDGELAAMRIKTGAERDATAVAAFVRLNLTRRGGRAKVEA